jgi:CBS domain-containing protein
MTAAHSPERYQSVRELMKTDVPTISSKADLFEEGLPILQQSGLRALPVTENAELVGMLTIEDVGNARLLRPLPATEKVSTIDDRPPSQQTASR